MENQIKNSFIPHNTISTSINLQTNKKGSAAKIGQRIFSIFAMFVFFGSLVVVGLIYLWGLKLEKDIINQVAIMDEARKNFDEKFIQAASRLNTRITEAEKILENHMSPSSVYSLLEDYTLHATSFSKFSFTDNQDGSTTVSGQGDAIGYESIVLQSDYFGKSGYLRNVIFTNLRPDDKNKIISFSFKATLDPKLVFYRNSLPSNNKK